MGPLPPGGARAFGSSVPGAAGTFDNAVPRSGVVCVSLGGLRQRQRPFGSIVSEGAGILAGFLGGFSRVSPACLEKRPVAEVSS